MSTSETPYILVVDDNKITTRLLRRYLESNGFETGEASDGVECLEHVGQRQPDAIILDVMMPRMDGIDTARAIKQNADTHPIPVVIVTALNDVATQTRAVEAGADDFLTKPIEEKLLIAKARLLTELGAQRRRVLRLRSIVEAYRGGTNGTPEMQELLQAEGFSA
jgi:CheY-like chemotaxis protein